MKRSNKLRVDQKVTVIVKEEEKMIDGGTIETKISIVTVTEMVMMLAMATTMRTVKESTDLARKNAGASETTKETVKMIPEAKGLRSNSKFRGNSRPSQMTISSKSVTMPCQVSCLGTFKTSTNSITGLRT